MKWIGYLWQYIARFCSWCLALDMSLGVRIGSRPFLIACIAVVFLVGASIRGDAAPLDLTPTISTCMAASHKLPMRDVAAKAEQVYGIPDSLLIRAIDNRENRSWDREAVSTAGAVGLAQVKPIAVCTRIADCNKLAIAARTGDKAARWALNSRLGVIEEKLKGVSYGLCWGARVMRDNLTICKEDKACALAGYLNGEFTSRYVAEILEN